jgi:hypothetical protein
MNSGPTVSLNKTKQELSRLRCHRSTHSSRSHGELGLSAGPLAMALVVYSHQVEAEECRLGETAPVLNPS